MSRKNNSVLLDVDPSIMENSLFITKQDENSDPSFQSLLNNLSSNTWDADLVDGEKRDISPQCKLVKPFPGFCVKTWKETGEKFFINVCHTEHIPQPDEISDEDLMKLLLASSEEGSSTDFGNLRSDFRVPMSIGKLHKETDKSGQPCDVCDVAINTTFFNMKVLKNSSFKMFLMTVALEGVDDKYSVQIDYKKKPITLKHCKVMGKIEAQMVQNRSAGGSGGLNTNQPVKKQLIEEIPADNNRSPSTSGTTSPGSVTTPHCQYQILMDPESVAANQTVPNYLTVNVFIKRPVITSGKGISLDVGEDRVLLRTSPSKQTSTANKSSDIIPVSDTFSDNSDSSEKVLLDIFLPYNVVRESCKACFNSDNRVLTIDMAVAA